MKQADVIDVLLVEDDPDDRLLLRKQLDGQPGRFKLEWVSCLSDALETLGRRSFDIVLTDLSLPDSVGLVTVTRLRQLIGQTPILVLTSLEDDRVERQILEAGAQDYLVKGELGGRAVSRAVVHAVQRQRALNEVTALVQELEQSRRLMQRKNEDLQRLNNTAQEIVGNVSHDLRTPLTVIKDYVGIISEGIVGEISDEQRALLEKVSVRADDLNTMVDDLLDASRLESGLLSAWLRSIDLVHLVGQVSTQLAQRANVSGVELKVDCPDDLPRVYCDSDQVTRVITNLAINAIKQSAKQGAVKLWVRHDPSESQVLVGVADEGPGVDQQTLHQILAPCEQRGGPVVNGVGVGMKIAGKLCRLNLGELRGESQVGSGSTFSFDIPLADPHEVLRRWSARLPKEARELYLNEVRAPNDASTESTDDLDSFLNCFVRRGDLLLRVGGRAWLLVMVASAVEVDQWSDWVTEQRTRSSSSRPSGPLPEFRVERRRAWTTDSPLEERMADFARVHLEAAPASGPPA